MGDAADDRQHYTDEFTGGAGDGTDYTAAATPGNKALLPRWILATTLAAVAVIVDGRGKQVTLHLAAGEVVSTQVRKLVSATNTVRIGSGDEPASVGPTGPAGAAGAAGAPGAAGPLPSGKTTVAMIGGAIAVVDGDVVAGSHIVWSRKTVGGTPGHVSITAQGTGGFTLTSSSNTETSTFNYTVLAP